MCLCCCELWTWRISSFVISLICITVGFIYGPFHTITYFTGNKPEMAKTLQKETNLAVFLWFLAGLMWYICLSNVFLFCACLYKNIKLLNVYIILTIVQMIVTFLFCLKYLIHCTLVDRFCFDHSNRMDNDVGAVIGVMLANVIYTIAWFVVLFVVCNYKLTLE